MASRHWLYFGGFVLTGLALVVVVLMGVLDALAVLSSGAVVYGEEFVLLAMLGRAGEWVVAAVVVGLIAVLFLVATIVSVLRNTSLHRDDRLAAIVERLEHEYPLLRQFDVSKRVEPTVEDRQQQLKSQYVDGKISDEEFEREMEHLMDEERST
ncbi:SHOCT domain-containing protein [Halorhabdus rudnickae]|uniref:SHOCT domain-containing protein n=1 Tax=Halorhabdus rudnickae TaxID=1775544 RepID=UPI00108305BD|nr:SHOCT domain-containing protein [Halorhabdus rudnickae]